MKEYDFGEIHEMQEKALERVRQMNLQAKLAVEEPEKEFIREPAFVPLNSHKGHIQMPVNLPSEYQSREKAQDTQLSEVRTQNILSDILDEPDKALLLSLVLLFKGDKSNEELMMALIYIMLA